MRATTGAWMRVGRNMPSPAPLACIQALMSDADELRTKYGVDDTESDDFPSQLVTPNDIARVSSSRLDAFMTEFGYYQSRLTKGHSNEKSFRKRAKWAIHDKDRFSKLVEELEYFNGKLGNILPPTKTSINTGPIAVHTGVQEDHDSKALEMILEASRGRGQTVADVASYALKELSKNKILDTLWFRRLTERKDSIKLAHRSTLAWTLKPSQEYQTLVWDNLLEWLRAGSGVYWVCGKAGSGKSTLMRYVCDNEETVHLLSKWSDGKPCHVASYFFLNLGVPEQNTLQGLGRSLLHQILSRRRDLISLALPTMWKEREVYSHDPEAESTMPSLTEMKQAFDNIGGHLEHSEERLCLFVDGLDEFSGGKHTEAVSFIKYLAGKTSIKTLVSSRPIPECVDAFDRMPKLQLQDLNRGDITKYVQDVIDEHKYMKRLVRRFPEEANAIVQDLVDKSSGVFLWVVLACRALLSGFSDFDRIAELRKRMEELPPELEAMFQHMLMSVGARHRQQAAKLLKICFTREQKAVMWTGKSLPRDMYALSLAVIGDYDEVPIDFEDDEYQDLCDDLEGRLRSRTSGLLEVVHSHWNDCWNDSRVEFLHRTVFEFLSQDDVWQLECLALPDRGFNAATALALGAMYLASHGPTLHYGHTAYLQEGLLWALEADAQMPSFKGRVFWNLWPFWDRLIIVRGKAGYTINDQLSRYNNLKYSQYCLPAQHTHVALQYAIRAGAVNFVKSHLKLAELARECAPPLLKYVRILRHAKGFLPQFLEKPSMDMLSLLLSSGCDPNACLDCGKAGAKSLCCVKNTVWMAWLGTACTYTVSDLPEAFAVTRKFLEAGASLRSPNETRLRSHLAPHASYGIPEIEGQAQELLEMLKNEN